MHEEDHLHTTTQLITHDSLDFGVLQKRAGHKFSHGHALCLAGGAGRTGAARLAARAALRIGAGLVTLGAPVDALHEIATQVTAIMLRAIPDDTALREVLLDQRLNAVCIGPGLGLDANLDGMVGAVLRSGRSAVFDADALSLIARNSSLFDKLHSSCVLTPHFGEFARVFPDISERLNQRPVSGPAFSKVDAVRLAAMRAGCVVVLKGADTVIADQTGATFVHAACYERSAPWLATAGSGDVLSGLITGLLARGVSPLDAAKMAVWIHVEAARHFGPGLIAEDLVEHIPPVLRAVLG